MCVGTKALHMELVEEYSANALLTALGKCFARRNLPASTVTDRGTQMVKARKLLVSEEPEDQGFTEKHLESLQGK